ncbi:VOC family protein [Pelagicoccus mobilis]|uniref:VOC family protein n=1 Tax=Pelagicoccus mobilis TaxID=415221 RepID=A0A934RRG1_9BACT|nr:VOC family protein [Pelagicoccus mobilis]MBK1876190.1 VOC family protein [Pelagicoccus mobilis]
MKLSKLDHVALVCSDSKRSKKWYETVFEMEWIFRGKWDNNPYFLKKGGAQIALFQASPDSPTAPRKGPRIDHFAFGAETRADYEKVKESLSSKSVPFEEQDHEVALSIYLKDPDGITVEVTTYDLT